MPYFFELRVWPIFAHNTSLSGSITEACRQGEMADTYVKAKKLQREDKILSVLYETTSLKVNLYLESYLYGLKTTGGIAFIRVGLYTHGGLICEVIFV